MKIEASAVSMSSNRSYYSRFEQHSEELITTSEKAATLEFSDESKSLVEQMKDYKGEQKEKSKEQSEGNAKKNIAELVLSRKNKNQAVENTGVEAKSEKDIQLEVMRRILELLNAMRKGKSSSYAGVAGELKQLQRELKSSKTLQLSGNAQLSIGGGNVIDVSRNTGAVSRRETTWKKITVTSAFYTEAEHTAYRAGGFVKTADGRELNFNVDVEMSRAFCEKYESCMEESYTFVDPLVINLDSNVGSVSDQKFLFDLNADGEEEEISFAGVGSGFLVLDKNGDGKIGDGSELFGTQS